MNVVTNGLFTQYSRSDAGQDKQRILCLHGWGDTHTNIYKFVSSNTDQSVVALDLPGFGGTQSPKTAWSLLDYAKFVADFCEKIEYRPDTIIAHSNGGAIAMKGCSKKLLQPKKLVLLASSGVRAKQKSKKAILKGGAKLAKALAAPLPQNIQKRLKRVAYKVVGSDYFVAEHLQETFKKVVSEDIVDEARSIGCKTLLAYGENDTATPPSYGEELAGAIADSRLEIIPAAGHFLFLDDPKTTWASVQSFLL